jgi:hypothetical protein
MPKTAAHPILSAALTPAPIIDPRAVYGKDQLRRLLGLRGSSIGREIREGRLRVSRRCGRYFFTGTWILQWLEGGELTKNAPGRGANSDTGAEAL